MECADLDVMCLPVPAASTRGVGGGGGGGGERPALRSLASLAADADARGGLSGLTQQPTTGAETAKEGMEVEEQGSDPLNGQGLCLCMPPNTGPYLASCVSEKWLVTQGSWVIRAARRLVSRGAADRAWTQGRRGG